MVACINACGLAIRWGSRAEHSPHCQGKVVGCPFVGCGYETLVGELDRHTAVCRFGVKHNVQKLIQAIVDRSANYIPAGGAGAAELDVALNGGAAAAAALPAHYRPPGMSDAGYARVLARVQHEVASAADDQDDKVGEGLIKHYVIDSDTLFTVAVKYSTTSDEILRLNKMQSSTIFSRQYVLVPKPPGFVAEAPPITSMAVLVALRKRRLTQMFVKKVHHDSRGRTKLQMEEAVAYLHMVDYDYDSAIGMYREDSKWEEEAAAAVGRPPPAQQTFKGFLLACREMDRGPPCHSCNRELTILRGHCCNCGAIVCSVCIEGGLLCNVEKRHLGVTAPGALEATVPVCNTCVSKLAVPKSSGHDLGSALMLQPGLMVGPTTALAAGGAA